MGEDVALGDAQPGLRLATENTLVHSLAPVVNDIVVKEAKRVIVKFTLELPDGPLGYSPQTGDSSRSDTIFQSIKDGQFFESRQWLAVGSPWPHSRSFSSSSHIGGFFLVGGMPLRGVLNVTLCLSHVVQLSLNRHLQDTIHRIFLTVLIFDLYSSITWITFLN